jgi:hypothetical protein
VVPNPAYQLVQARHHGASPDRQLQADASLSAVTSSPLLGLDRTEDLPMSLRDLILRSDKAIENVEQSSTKSAVVQVRLSPDWDARLNRIVAYAYTNGVRGTTRASIVRAAAEGAIAKLEEDFPDVLKMPLHC